MEFRRTQPQARHATWLTDIGSPSRGARHQQSAQCRKRPQGTCGRVTSESQRRRACRQPPSLSPSRLRGNGPRSKSWPPNRKDNAGSHPGKQQRKLFSANVRNKRCQLSGGNGVGDHGPDDNGLLRQ